MQIDIEWEVRKETSVPYEKITREIVEEAADFVGCPYDISVSVLFIEDEEMHRINLENRGIDKSTDVLSFPMFELESPGVFTEELEEDPGNFDPDSGELLLGDIILNWDRVLSQAEEYGHSVERELAFLIAHSMLHLFSFDHMEEEERKEMEEKQEAILQNRGYLR